MLRSSPFPVSQHQRLMLAAASLACSSLVLSCLSLPALAEKAAPLPNLSQIQSGSETDYTLGAGDRLRVDIFQIQDFSRDYLVLVDGTVSFPLVGTIKVEGLSTDGNSSTRAIRARTLACGTEMRSLSPPLAR